MFSQANWSLDQSEFFIQFSFPPPPKKIHVVEGEHEAFPWLKTFITKQKLYVEYNVTLT